MCRDLGVYQELSLYPSHRQDRDSNGTRSGLDPYPGHAGPGRDTWHPYGKLGLFKTELVIVWNPKVGYLYNVLLVLSHDCACLATF